MYAHITCLGTRSYSGNKDALVDVLEWVIDSGFKLQSTKTDTPMTAWVDPKNNDLYLTNAEGRTAPVSVGEDLILFTGGNYAILALRA